MSETTVAIVSPGAMGAAVGARLVANGVRVVTPTGRSAASERRAVEAGLSFVDPSALGAVDFVFSIVPPSQAMEAAKRLAPIVGAAANPPLFVDWNAVSVGRVREVEAIVVEAGGRFADGSIIGPPKADGPGPVLYASGAAANALLRLENKGIRFAFMDAEVGAASALKMSYAGITKGLTALGAAMLLAADRAGCSPALLSELAASQPQLLASFRKGIPDMFPKARRWAPELEEIAAFVGPERTESGIYASIAAFYRHLAEDNDAGGPDIATLAALTKPAV